MEWLVVLTFLVGFLASVLSSMSGGGGGFITVPYLIFIGLPPANALATSKLGALGVAAGSMTAFRGKGLVRKKLVVPLMLITLGCSLVAAWLIPRINPGIFMNIIGVALIVFIPTLFVKKASLTPGRRSKPWVIAGFVLYLAVSFMQTIVASGTALLLVLVLILFFGLSALEANATKRVAQSVQAVVLFVLLALQGLVVWTHGVAGLLGALAGSYVGTHIAIKRGDTFVKVLFAFVMLISGLALLLG